MLPGYLTQASFQASSVADAAETVATTARKPVLQEQQNSANTRDHESSAAQNLVMIDLKTRNLAIYKKVTFEELVKTSGFPAPILL